MIKNAMVPGILCISMQNLEVSTSFIDEMKFYAKGENENVN
jgi:hypothetical protein